MSITKTEATHAASIKRLAELNADYARAKQAADDAQRCADEVLTSAAAGATVTAADLVKARTNATKTADTASLALALRDAGQAAVDRAEAEVLHAIADDMRSQEAALTAEAHAAAAEVDRAVEAAQAALASLVAIEDRFADLRGRIHEAAGRVTAAARTNATFKSQHASAHPKLKATDAIGIRGAATLAVALRRVTSADPAIVRTGVASVLGLLAGPNPTLVASMDVAAKLRLAGQAQMDAINAGSAAGEARRQRVQQPSISIQRGAVL